MRSDIQGLISEVGDLSRRNDELMTAKDADLMVIRDLDAQLKEYKRKYEQAKTELRNVKGEVDSILYIHFVHTLISYFATLSPSPKGREDGRTAPCLP
jgi:archaellum component FlaC